MDQANKDFLTVEQAAAYLGVGRAYLHRLLRQHGLGEFLRASIGRQVLISRDDLDKLRPTVDKRPQRRRPGAA
jgi:excisionase family DNA binding protein